MDYSTDLRQAFREAGMQGGLQIGLTKGQAVSSPQSTAVEPSRVESSLASKELVERDLDHNPSTYIKY